MFMKLIDIAAKKIIDKILKIDRNCYKRLHGKEDVLRQTLQSISNAN